MNKLKRKAELILQLIQESIRNMLKQTVLLLTQMISISAVFIVGLMLSGVQFTINVSDLHSIIALASSGLLWICFLLLLNERLDS